MAGSAGDRVDPAHWVSVGGGLLFMFAVGICSFSLMTPWWAEHKVTPGKIEGTEVTLWIRHTRLELAADDSTLNCAEQCDFTKIGSAKVREEREFWSEVCLKATGPIATNCKLLWVVRVAMLLSWFFALLFAVISTLNFCGAGLPASLRIPAAVKIGLALSCAIASAVALIVAGMMDIRLQPTPPGTRPGPLGTVAMRKVGLSGMGFWCALGTCIVSLIGIGVAYFMQYIIDHMAKLDDPEQGRPLADVNRGVPPTFDPTKVGVALEDLGNTSPKEPPGSPKPLGSWMT